MLLRAAADLNLDLDNSWIVGDKLSDLEAGEVVGLRSVLVRTGHGVGQEACVAPGTPVMDTILEAALYIEAQTSRNLDSVGKPSTRCRASPQQPPELHAFALSLPPATLEKKLI